VTRVAIWAVTVATHRGTERAKVALARKIGISIHRMLIYGFEFRCLA
jgi:hypothetical protein